MNKFVIAFLCLFLVGCVTTKSCKQYADLKEASGKLQGIDEGSRNIVDVWNNVMDCENKLIEANKKLYECHAVGQE